MYLASVSTSQLLLFVFGVSVVSWAAWLMSGLRKNISAARRSGVPYIVVPWSSEWDLALLLAPLWKPIIQTFLPRSWWEPWLDLLLPDTWWRTGHRYFDKYGEMFMVVSPGRIQLILANAEVTNQVTALRDRFPKDIKRYDILKQFGDNMITAEGATWRMHRKLTAGSFNEENTALVFRETIHQTQSMIKYWKGPAGKRTESLRAIEHDTMRFALNIISYAGFGLSLLWPGEKMAEGQDPKLAKYGSLEVPPGHQMCFVDTMEQLLQNLVLLLVLPSWLLKRLPSKTAKRAAISHDDYSKYLDELMDEKIEEARQGSRAEIGMDIMGHLVRSTYGPGKEGKDGIEKMQKTPALTRSEIIGNAFFMFLAGHETTANVAHFCLVELAANPASQRRLQKDIDELVGDTDPKLWDYESLVNPMMANMLGATMNEMMRLMPPVVEIPKLVSADQGVVVKMDGDERLLPNGMGISLLPVSLHRNRRYWPTQPSKIHAGTDDIDDFVPERWLRVREKGGEEKGEMEWEKAEAEAKEAGLTEEVMGPEEPVTSAQLFRPKRGAFFPFSDGARSCLGRRIAQVEIIAMLAVVFQRYSLELAVDEWASDEEVSSMSRDKAREVYAAAQDKCRDTLKTAHTVLTLKLPGGKHVPVRLVRRGEERFVNWIDA